MSQEKMSPEEVAESNESRILSDAELIKGGAHYKPTEGGEPRLEVTPEQVDEIKANSSEEKRISIEKFEEKSHEAIQAYENEIDDFIKSFPAPENATPEDISKLCVSLGETEIRRGQEMPLHIERKVGEFAKKMNFPIKISERTGGRWWDNKNYEMGDEVKEVAEKILNGAHEKLLELAFKVSEEQVAKQKKTSEDALPEVQNFLLEHEGMKAVDSVENARGGLRYMLSGRNPYGYVPLYDFASHREYPRANESDIRKYLKLMSPYFEVNKKDPTNENDMIMFLFEIGRGGIKIGE